MKCVVGCPVRNISNFLYYTFNNIDIISKCFSDCHVVFFYDISNDDTLEKIQNYKNYNKDKINIIMNTEDLLQHRTHRIANARNKLLEYIETNHSDATYYILLDCGDESSYKINNEILNKYLFRNDWDALFFNRLGLPCPNYDIWALQFDIFIQNCWSLSDPINMITIMRNKLEEKLHNLLDDELLEVYSAFNGIGIYRLEKFKGIRYDGEKQRYFSNLELENMLENIRNIYNLDMFVTENATENCEHIGFHINAIRQNGARIRMSKDIIYQVYQPKIQIYISNNFSKYYMPFLLYRQSLYCIFQRFLTNNIEYIYDIDHFDNNKDTILIMNMYCLNYTTEKDIFSIIQNTSSNVILINTEFYQHHNIDNIMKWINDNNLKFFVLEYNIINYNYFKQNYINLNIFFAPLIYHSHLEYYYKQQIEEKFIKWNEKDIDVLFIGRLNERRSNVLDQLRKKYNIHIISGFTGELENKSICGFYERSKIVINILYQDDNSIFDYYRNTFIISNKVLLVSESPKNINYDIEHYLTGMNENLFLCEYNNFVSTIDNILTNYNEDQINEIKEKQYRWFKEKETMDYFINFIKKYFMFNY